MAAAAPAEVEACRRWRRRDGFEAMSREEGSF
jgi:hypothetical protein